MTPKQAAFVAEYLIDMNATQAAIRAGYSAKTAGSQGFDLLRKPEIAEAVRKASSKVAENAEMTVEKHLRDLKSLRDEASAEGKFSAAVAAEVARGKVAGFYIEKVEMDATVKGSVVYKANIPVRSK